MFLAFLCGFRRPQVPLDDARNRWFGAPLGRLPTRHGRSALAGPSARRCLRPVAWTCRTRRLHLAAAMSQAIDKAVSRIAQYRPFAHEGRDLDAALRDLVLGAAAEAGGGFAHLAECQGAIQTLFNLEIEIDELRNVVDALAADGACSKASGGFTLSSSEHDRMEQQAATSLETETKAFRDWEAGVRVMDPALTEEDFKALRSDLDVWLQHVITRHGVEAALLLYPENPRAHELYRELDELGFSFLPPDRSQAVRRIREQAIQVFVQQPTPEQRSYLSNLLNVAYFLTVLSLDPSASELVQERVQGHRIYLDTNVLYRALGLSKVREVLSARRLLALSKELGFELAITPWTLNELKESLKRAEQSVKSRALPPRELAALMSDATSQEGFITAYWRQYKDSGIAPQEFFEFYSALETLLTEDGIRVVEEGVLAIDRNDEAIESEISILERVLVSDKAEPVLRHDVKHCLLIERLRGAGNVRFANARFWFLTQDSALPRYAQLRYNREHSGVPFCASTSAWTQTMRSLVPRTDDLDQALVDLLASPYMRYRGGVSPQLVQEVVARIDQYEGVTPALASEVLLNGALIRDLSRMDDPTERAAKIDNALVRSAQELHEKLDALSQSEREQREAARSAEAARRSSEQEMQAAYARVHELERAVEEHQGSWAVLADELTEAERTSEQRAQASQTERANLEKRVALTEEKLARRARLSRAIGAAALATVGLTALAILLAASIVTTVWPVVGVVFGALCLVCLGVWVLAGWRRAWQTFVVVGIIVGVVAGIQQLAAGSVAADHTHVVSTSQP
jgi:hypothetical protein